MFGIDERRQFFGSNERLNFTPGKLGFALDTIERDVQRSLAGTGGVVGDSSLGRSVRRGARSRRDFRRARHLGR